MGVFGRISGKFFSDFFRKIQTGISRGFSRENPRGLQREISKQILKEKKYPNTFKLILRKTLKIKSEEFLWSSHGGSPKDLPTGECLKKFTEKF